MTDVTAADTVAVLYPIDQETKERNGAYTGKMLFADGRKLAFSLRGNIFFQAEQRTFTGIDGTDGFSPVLTELVADGKAFITRSHVGHTGKFIRRIKDRRGKCPAGIRRARLHLLALDLDAWPNLDRHDPRVDSEAARRWMICVLGSEFEDLRIVAQWTSSACVGAAAGTAPATLDARLWVWMDRPLGEKAAAELLKRLDLRAKAYFAERGVTFLRMGNGQEKKLVDPKVADATQPIYIVPPVCVDGLEDPLTGVERTALLDGSRESLDVEALWASLPTISGARASAATASIETPGEKQGTDPEQEAPRGTVRVPRQSIPIGPAAMEIEAIRKLMHTGGANAVLEGCVNTFHLRMALEMTAVAVHRGGLDEGARDEGATRIASALVAAMPLRRDLGWVCAQIRRLLVLAAGEEWVMVEWEGAGADASIIANYERASRGEPGRFGRKDPRYTYGKARLIEEWRPSREEIRALRLRSLCSEADRAWLEREISREESGTPMRENWLLASRRLAPEVHRLRSHGLSWRAVAGDLDEPVSNVQRLGRLTQDQLTAVTLFLEHEEREQAAEIAETFASEAASFAPTPEDLVAGLLDAGVETVGAIVDWTGLPRHVVADILVDFGVLDPVEAVGEHALAV